MRSCLDGLQEEVERDGERTGAPELTPLVRSLQWHLGHELTPGVCAELSLSCPGLGGWSVHPGCVRVPVPKTSWYIHASRAGTSAPGSVCDPQCLVLPRFSSAGMVGLHRCLQTPCPWGQQGPGSGPFTSAGAGTAIHLGCPWRKAPSGAHFPSLAQLFSS